MKAAFFALLFAFSAQAAEPSVDVSGGAGEPIVLHASSCEILKTQIQAIQALSHNFGESTDCSKAPEQIAYECIADITACVPAIVRRQQGLGSNHNGPNCFNLVLNALNLAPAFLESSDQEMDDVIKSPFCRELSKTEKPQAGDVLLIRDGSIHIPVNESHAAIFISPDLAFSKNGPNGAHFELQAMEPMLNRFDVNGDGSCFQYVLDDGETIKDCDKRVSYHRCARGTAIASEQIIRAEALFSEVSRRFGALTLTDRKFDIAETTSLIRQTTAALSSVKNPNANDQKELMLLHHWVESVQTQSYSFDDLSNDQDLKQALDELRSKL